MSSLRFLLQRLRDTALALSLLATLGAHAAPTPACSARSGPVAPAVVELYTSEGCSSCPPAEHWLSGLQGRSGVVTLAFHVDYWDNLGWKDRFAQPQFTQRQNAGMRTNGARFAYTPQVVLDGRDTPAWHALPAIAPPASPVAPVDLQLDRAADGLTLTVSPHPNAPRSLSGYVAVVDDGLQTRVGAGENRGETLHQDAVVRQLLPWTATGPQPSTLHFATTAPAEPGAARRWVAVATDGASGRPVQALALTCTR